MSLNAQIEQPFVSDVLGERWISARYDTQPYIQAPASVARWILARRHLGRLGPVGAAMLKAAAQIHNEARR